MLGCVWDKVLEVVQTDASCQCAEISKFYDESATIRDEGARAAHGKESARLAASKWRTANDELGWIPVAFLRR